MIVSINKQTGLLIEGQSHADAATMLANAVAMGFDPANVDVQTVDDVTFNALLAAVNPPPRRLIPKSVIVDRLHAAGKLDAARAALDAASLYTRERWNTRDSIYSDDLDAVALIKAIGGDPDAILGP